MQKKSIKHFLWNGLTYEPKVSFSIAYNDCIFLKYFVNEKYISAKYLNHNNPVYKDSCVEFFHLLIRVQAIIILNLMPWYCTYEL